jgi:hypothetical protein
VALFIPGEFLSGPLVFRQVEARKNNVLVENVKRKSVNRVWIWIAEIAVLNPSIQLVLPFLELFPFPGGGKLSLIRPSRRVHGRHNPPGLRQNLVDLFG